MDIAQLIQTLVATVVGGLIVIATNWIGKQEERRVAIKEWYEKTYIAEGIEPVLTYLFHLALYFNAKSYGGFVRVKDIEIIPIEGIVRLQILLDNSVVPRIIRLAHSLLSSDDKQLNNEVAVFLTDTSQYLADFRKELLDIIATQVRTKHTTVDTSDVVKKLKKIADELSDLAHNKRESASI